ncbi:MAG: two-component regulator propeller domain-containing protein [bacterium]
MNRSHKHLLLALTACLTLPAQVHAQRSPLVFKQISPERGLSQKTVYAIVQDSVGFLWFGTQDGLNRYDGYSFKIYKNIVSDSTSLSDNRVRALYLDRRHTLWIGTSNGLNRYDPQTDSFTRYFHDPGNPKSLSDHDVRAQDNHYPAFLANLVVPDFGRGSVCGTLSLGGPS